ncbi:C-factor-like [Alosa sapidissima]|uniref:C-factor-like n=1 Tax=Alosa sapidissima TaxID=34773 RepID=UPI001C084AA0|nr:C-factor-like [Alosa sapidissima]
MAGKVCNVLITGANRGLGLEMVKQLAEMPCPGRRIFACCRDPNAPKAQSLQELAKKHPGVIHVIRLDVADLSSIQESAKQVGSVLGKDGLNLLVNNAAMAPYDNTQTAKLKDLQDTFQTNVIGTMMVTKEFLPYLREAAKSSGKPGMSCCKAAVINISTILSSITKAPENISLFPTLALTYRISKAGLNMLTVCQAQEFKADGVLFTLLHPGWVRTDMGGADGEIDARESVSGMLRVMDSLTEKHNGGFLDYKGQPLPW